MKNCVLHCVLIAGILTAPAAIRGQTVEPPAHWKNVCAACHGPDGRGKTKAGRMAGVKDFSDPQYQKSFTDEQAVKSIREGTVDEKGKQMMLPFGAMLTDADIEGLVAFIRSLVPVSVACDAGVCTKEACHGRPCGEEQSDGAVCCVDCPSSA